jgi:hypothetical protein
MATLSIADVFAPGAGWMLLYLVGAFVVPGAIGLTVRRLIALAIVLMLWVALMLLAVPAGWLNGSDDLSSGGKVTASVVLILLPALAVTAGSILLGRSIRRVPDAARQSRENQS